MVVWMAGFPSKRSFYVYLHFISTRAQITILFLFSFLENHFRVSQVTSESKKGIQQMDYVRGHHHTFNPIVP